MSEIKSFEELQKQLESAKTFDKQFELVPGYYVCQIDKIKQVITKRTDTEKIVVNVTTIDNGTEMYEDERGCMKLREIPNSMNKEITIWLNNETDDDVIKTVRQLCLVDDPETHMPVCTEDDFKTDYASCIEKLIDCPVVIAAVEYTKKDGSTGISTYIRSFKRLDEIIADING